MRLFRKIKEVVASKQDECNVKLGCLQSLLLPYSDSVYHVAERLHDKGVRFEAGRAVATNNSKDERVHFLCNIFLVMRDGVWKDIAHARASINERSSLILEILRSIEDEL